LLLNYSQSLQPSDIVWVRRLEGLARQEVFEVPAILVSSRASEPTRQIWLRATGRRYVLQPSWIYPSNWNGIHLNVLQLPLIVIVLQPDLTAELAYQAKLKEDVRP
jgi:hypothetical protein